VVWVHSQSDETRSAGAAKASVGPTEMADLHVDFDANTRTQTVQIDESLAARNAVYGVETRSDQTFGTEEALWNSNLQGDVKPARRGVSRVDKIAD